MPFANPSPKLSFASFVSQFPSTDQSFEPTLFRLGHALFDTIDFRLDQIPDIAARQRIADNYTGEKLIPTLIQRYRDLLASGT